MTVTIKDDGKGKSQSFTATLDLPHTNTESGHFFGEVVGYGATAFEARQNLFAATKVMSVVVATAAAGIR